MENNIVTLNEYDLTPVREGLLRVYKEVVRICEKFSLQYWAAFGTALGAVRHKGFIPWDDDFDLMMPREDYDRFMELANSELPDYMKTVSIFNTKEFNWGFGKVQDCRASELERIQKLSNYRLPDGVYVDIFPIDGCCKSYVSRFCRMISSTFVHLAQRFVLEERNPLLHAFVGWLAGLFLPNIRGARDLKLYDIMRLRCPMFDGAIWCGYMVDGVSRGPERQPLLVDWFKETKMLPFEDTKIPVPIGVAEILRVWYGDYMVLPPISKRKAPSHANDPVVAWRLGPTGGV